MAQKLQTEFRGYKPPTERRYPKVDVCEDDGWVILGVTDPERSADAALSLSPDDARGLAATLIALADQAEVK